MIKMTSLAKLTLLVGLCTSTAVSANALKKTEFGFSGYIKLDAIAPSYSDGTLGAGSIDRDFYIPSLTPVGGNDEET